MLRTYLLPLVGFSTLANAASFNCMPNQSCWPTTETWQSFNASLGGLLGITHMWADACYTDPSSAACVEAQEGYVNYEARSAQYGAMDNLNWETCGTKSCLLYSLAPQTPVTGECFLGRMSAYYVEAHNASDIIATLAFVQAHNLRLSIKNTGHDYFGRSSAANSLALWTHNMKQKEFHSRFALLNCDAGTSPLENIGVIGAGVQALEAVSFFQDYGMQVTVGAVESVGIAGGFGQAGGHGPFAPSYGLMVDQAVEFDVVTASGEFLTINKCNHPDLFWAMRGGGGGTYAVLVNYKFKVHQALPINVHAFQADLLETPTDLTQSSVHRDVVTGLANNQTIWSNNKIAGYNFFLPNNIISLQILPSENTTLFKELTADWTTFLSSHPGLNITANEYKTFANYTDYAAYALPFLFTNGPVGVGILEASRLIPRAQFTTESSINDLVSAFLQGLQTSLTHGAGLGTGSGQIYSTGPANTYDEAGETGVNPAWRGSLWEVIHGGIYLSTDNQTIQDNIASTVAKAIEPFKALTPGGGTYANEGDYNEPDWEQTFWGAHYDRLLAIKKTYDPEGLFNCFKCVGWNGPEDPFYSCYYPDSSPQATIPLDPSQS